MGKIENITDYQEPIISLSTSYLQNKFSGDGYAMLCEAADMGFGYVELGHSTTNESIEGIRRALSEGVVKVSSLHNFCPIPPFAKGAAPNLFSPSTPSATESLQWLRHTKNTTEFAKEFGAKAVVCHCGELSYFFMRPDRHVAKILDENGYEKLSESAEYPAYLAKFKKAAARRSERKDYLKIFDNITKLTPTSTPLMLGLENRESYSELPLDWNIEKFFEIFKDAPDVHFWHDTGHSKRKELAGLGAQTELAERTAEVVCGWHLHDCSSEGKDHIAIGKGCVDFKAMAKFFNPKKHIFTLELNRAVTRDDAIDSLKRVQDLI